MTDRSPIAPRDATPAATLFLLAHHDDEVFCAGHLRRTMAMGAGSRLGLLWATTGGLAPARRRLAEGQRVRDLLGLATENAPDLGLPDKGALDHVATIVREAESLLGRLEHGGRGGPAAPPAIFVPAYEGGHPDHDALNLAAAVLCSRRPDVRAFEFPLYRRGRLGLAVQSTAPPLGSARPPGGSASGNWQIAFLDDDAIALRRALVGANGSQRFVSLEPLLALARLAGRGRAVSARPLPAHDYATRPHEGRLLYELYTRRRFAQFAAVAAVAVRSLSDAGRLPPSR